MDDIKNIDLFSLYIKEREGRSLISNDFGFAIYQKITDDTVWLIDIFVIKEKRRNGIATELSNLVEQEAKKLGANKLLGSADVTKNGLENSLLSILHNGFKFSHMNGNALFFLKEIKE